MSLELQLEVCLRLVVAAFLSAIVGYDRERRDHPAGLRTHILIGLGAALFTALSMLAFGNSTQDRVAAQIVTGIGFLGADTIIQGRKRDAVFGMTTAAGIWAVAAVGMACGTGSYLLATVATILIWFTLAIVQRLEKRPGTVNPHMLLGDDAVLPAGPARNLSTAEPRDRRNRDEA